MDESTSEKQKGITRRDFLRLVAFSAAGVVLSGCLPEEERQKKAEIPKVSLKDLIANPSAYRDFASLQTNGFLEYSKADTYLFPIPVPMGDGMTIIFTPFLEETYSLHETVEPNSPSITTTSFGSGLPVSISNETKNAANLQEFKMVGKITEVRQPKTNEPIFLFQAYSATKVGPQ